MDRKTLKETIKGLCPNVPRLRKMLTRHEAKNRLHALIPDAEITAAELDSAGKTQLVEEYAKKQEKRYQRDEKTIDDLFDRAPLYQNLDSETKTKLRTDIHFCRFAYGFMPAEYLTYRLDEKNEEERRSFISEREHVLYYLKMNDVVLAQTFNDKMKTYRRFEPFYHREILSIMRKRDFPAFERFTAKHPVFVKKEVYESCGNSVAKVDMASCGKSKREVFNELLFHGKTVLEEVVEQGESTASFNASSVNTLRLIAFNTKHGVVIPYAFMKIGREGSFVDNGGAGGILAGVDIDTGIINTRGIDELHREYDVHPDSGMPFIGHQLPDWGAVMTICRELMESIPNIGYVGWDFAYTANNRWVVIEGNGKSQFIGPQTIWQRGIKAGVNTIMRDMDLIF